MLSRAAAIRAVSGLKDVLVTSGARTYSVVTTLIALVLTTRWLGPEGRGAVVVVTTWVGLFASVGYLSLGQVCLHRAAIHSDRQWLGPAIGALLFMTVAASLLGWAGACLLYLAGGAGLFGHVPVPALLLGFAALPFFIWEQYGSAMLTLIGRLGIYNMNQLVSKTLGLVVLAVTVLGLGWGIYGFLASYLIGQVLVAGAGIFVLWKHVGGRIRTSLAAVGGLVMDGLKLHLNAIGVLLFSSADILMLQYFRGLAETGIFQLASQLFLTLLIIPQSALLVLNGKVGPLDRTEFWKLHKKMMIQVMALMILAAGVLALLARHIIPLLATKAFSGAVPILHVYCFGVIAATLNTMMGIQWITRGYFLQASLLTFVTGAANCLLNLFLIPRYGALGAALATVGGIYAIPFTTNLIMIARIERESRKQESAPRAQAG